MSAQAIEVRPCKDMGDHVRKVMADEKPDFWGVYQITGGFAEWVADYADEATAEAEAAKLSEKESQP